MKGYEYQSDFAKKYVAQGRAEGFAEGFAQGFAEGLVEGLAMVHAEQRADEAAGALLAVLRVRKVAVPDADRERIRAFRDPERLERWLKKVVVPFSDTQVIDEPS